ncbi:polysaccharide biosynthesis protein [Bacteriovorax sp. Seq25_V]|uniref:polysaccharide biosynthesis protein n=1 Tax=Bacteriovorax sp. Seq25_V TaxID=1201288 RepID=UPI000389F479|nr:polysaccharide biosynthesis protein [Bacteriovorax sp. Seq25_V]EQC43292.1 polysaccharide biosynthesis protein [Bacteriovorax sp. Seq25_V]
MIQLLKNPRILIAFLYDIFIATFSFYFSIFLRFETFSVFDAPISDLVAVSFIFISCQVFFFSVMGLYRGMWRFSSTIDLIRILKASTYGTASALILTFALNRLEGFPRSIAIIDYTLILLGLGGGRFLYRLWKDNKNNKGTNSQPSKDNIIIIGAGVAGNQLAREVLNTPSMNLNIIGFLDDDSVKKGRSILGIRTLGNISLLPDLIEKHSISKVFIAIPSATSSQMKTIISICKDTNIEFKTLPKLNEILSGKIELSLLRNIKLEDLLGRDPINLDRENMKSLISDSCVLITGAGGSIGSELCRQVSLLNPKTVILLEICELFLYELEMNLIEEFPNIKFIPCIGDVRFKNRVEEVFNRHRPDLVLHAAAYKHVPMMESNPTEAIFTNVLGTKIVAESADKFGAKHFIMVSTDKAVNPTNIMGSTKRIAEMICQNINSISMNTNFSIVRFGNVLGSNGSVIPLFKKQIENGGPITVTHPDITRYFMSIPEACQLVLQASSMAKGGEIFVLDMGEPVKIVDLALNLIQISGLKVEHDIKIKFTGLRPGEKLYEELFSKDEELLKTHHNKIRIANTRPNPLNFNELIHDLLSIKCESDKSSVIKLIKSIVVEYTPNQEDLLN